MEGVDSEAAIAVGIGHGEVSEPEPAGSALDEKRLISQARRGDEDAVERLVRAHWDDAHRVAWMMLGDERAAEDVAQEAMLAALRALPAFDRRRPLAALVRRITTNRALDVIRARGSRPVEVDGEPPEGLSPEQDAGLSDPLQRALGRLGAEDRAAIVLRYLFGYTAVEVGAMLGMPAATVRTRLRRARLSLKRDLEEADD